MDSKEVLRSGFEYDLWANRQWVQAIGRFKDMEQAHAILEHILFAQRIWLERCGGMVPVQVDDTSLVDLFRAATSAWIDLVNESFLDQTVTYQNLRGVEFTDRFGHIATHVINHGTYHRGHLRGLADCQRIQDFPETDFIAYQHEF